MAGVSHCWLVGPWGGVATVWLSCEAAFQSDTRIGAGQRSDLSQRTVGPV